MSLAQIIGRRGNVIRTIRQQSGAQVDIERVDASGAADVYRQVHLSGDAHQVDSADKLIW